MTDPADALVGRSLLHYLLLERVGEGGMGDVYKAADQRLGRTVAVKVLRPLLVDSPERIARFEREARVASGLSHPHIATVYEVGQSDGVHFIAMEYVDGQGLSAWLAAHPSSDDVHRVLGEVGDALARAHAAGVLHRDLKPANVMVSREGYAKLLDFGLAKIRNDAVADSDAETQEHLTRSGVVLGTMAYMSPEQAKAQPVDRRSDIFSYGILMFEALTGFHPFSGTGGLEVATGVLRDDPIPLLRVRGMEPDLVRIMDKALQKEPARRYQFMDDLVVDLRAVRAAPGSASLATAVLGVEGPRSWPWLAAAAPLGLALALLATTYGPGWRPAPPEPLPLASPGWRLQPLTLDDALNRDPFISADGERVAYASDRSGSFDIVVQQIATGRTLRITENPGDELEPTFSSDGQTIAFVTSDGKLQTVPALGGTVRTLAEGGADRPAWSPDGERVAYRSHGRLFVVSRSGGVSTPMSPKQLPVLTGGTWSPDGRQIMFSATESGRYVLARVTVAGGEATIVGGEAQALGSPFWTTSGHWLLGSMGPPRDYASELWAVPVTEGVGRVGDPVRLLGGVFSYQRPSASRDDRRFAFGVVDLTTHVGRIPLSPDASSLQEPTRLPADARIYHAAVSHAGSSLAVVTDRTGMQRLWKMSPSSGGLEPLREGTGADEQPAWSPDDSRIAFSHIEPAEHGSRRIAVIFASGGALKPLSEPEWFATAPAWSPDGQTLAFAARGSSLRVVSVAGGPSRAIAPLSGAVRRLAWSPDGRRIVLGVLGADGEWSLATVPAEGGELKSVLANARSPLWLPDGRIVFLRPGYPGSLDVWSVRVGADGTPASEPAALTRLPRGQTIDSDQGMSCDGRSLYFTLLQRARDQIWLGEATQPSPSR